MDWQRRRSDLLWVGAALVVALCLVAAGAARGKLSWMALLIPLILAAGYLLGSNAPVYALAVLIGSIAVERAEIGLLSSSAVHLRLDEVLGPAVAFGLIVRYARGKTLLPLVRRIPGLLPLGLFLLANLVVTAITAETISRGNLARGLTLVVELIAGALCYLAVCLAVAAVREAREITFPLLLTAAVEAAIGIAALGLSLALGQRVFGVQTDFGTKLSEPYGTMYEANFFGHFTAAITALILALVVGLLAQRRFRQGKGFALLAVGGLTTVAMILSLTRTAWLALAVGITCMAAIYGAVVLARRRDASSKPRAQEVDAGTTGEPAPAQRSLAWLGLASLVVVALGIGIALMTNPAAQSGGPAVVSSPGTRAQTILDFGSGSGQGRLLILNLVLHDWLRSPLFGLGNGSFNILLSGQTGQPWIYSQLLSILHDSGIVGLVLFLWFLWAIGRGVWRTLRAPLGLELQWLTLGIAGAAITILVAAQATTSLYLMVLWVFLGLAAAMPALAGGRPEPESTSQAMSSHQSGLGIPIDSFSPGSH